MRTQVNSTKRKKTKANNKQKKSGKNPMQRGLVAKKSQSNQTITKKT